MGGATKPHAIRRVDAKGVARAWRAAMCNHEPSTLSKSELALDREPLTRAPHPVPVFAWIHFASIPVLVAGYAVAWTAHATAIKWVNPEGQEGKAWVWSNAVRPRRDTERHIFQTARDRGEAALEQASLESA